MFLAGKRAPAAAKVAEESPPGEPTNPPEEKTGDAPEPKLEASEEKKRTQEMATKKKTTKKTSSRGRNRDEAFEARVRKAIRVEKRKVWESLGLDGDFDETALNEKLDSLLSAREENKSVVERLEGREKRLQEENNELRSKVAELERASESAKHEAESAKAELEELSVEYELRSLATASGVTDLDYGLELFRRHASTLPEDADVNEGTVKTFFEELKKDPAKKYLFAEASVSAGPRPIAEKTGTQPQQTQTQPGQQGAPQGQPNKTDIPDQGAPKPEGAQTPDGEGANVLEMNKADFARHSREKYGYSPGMA